MTKKPPIKFLEPIYLRLGHRGALVLALIPIALMLLASAYTSAIACAIASMGHDPVPSSDWYEGTLEFFGMFMLWLMMIFVGLALVRLRFGRAGSLATDIFVVGTLVWLLFGWVFSALVIAAATFGAGGTLNVGLGVVLLILIVRAVFEGLRDFGQVNPRLAAFAAAVIPLISSGTVVFVLYRMAAAG